MKTPEALIKEMGIKGIFVKEIKENYEVLLKALIHIGLQIEDFGAKFGIYKATIHFLNREDYNDVINLLIESKLNFEYKNQTISVYSNKEPKIKKIKVLEKKNELYENKHPSFKELDEFLLKLKEKYPNAKDISFGAKYINFFEEIERNETETELKARIKNEDKNYILNYIEASKKYEEYKKMKNSLKGMKNENHYFKQTRGKKYIPLENSFLIRITSQLPFSTIDKEKYKNIYHYGFEDIDYECNYSISRDESLSLIKNLLENSNKEELVIHCDYAQSRSPAIAIAFSFILFGNDRFNYKNLYPDYNRFVLDRIVMKYNLIVEKIGSSLKEDIINYINNQNIKGELDV